MATETTSPSTLPAHFSQEWATSRELIAKLDERIHDARRLVFGLFSALLTAGTILGLKTSENTSLPRTTWLGVHLALLGLLLAGRFIERQAFQLQAAAASRAWVLELFTPVELTSTLSDLCPTSLARTTQRIYGLLGVVSAVVTAAAAFSSSVTSKTGQALSFLGFVSEPFVLVGFIGSTVLYCVIVFRLGPRDLEFARDGTDWSFSTTSCRIKETVSILLVNMKDAAVQIPVPAASLTRLFDEAGSHVAGPTLNLNVPNQLLEGQSLPKRRACRWVWTPSYSGVWALQVFDSMTSKTYFARRFIEVKAVLPPPGATKLELNPVAVSLECKVA